jgi:hypothetical protein
MVIKDIKIIHAEDSQNVPKPGGFGLETSHLATLLSVPLFSKYGSGFLLFV